jgi:hypothetical protein
MFIKLNRSGSRVYAQLAEAFRDEAGNPRNRVIATLGRLDKDDPKINSVLAGLVRATGSSVDLQPPSIDFDASHDFGDLSALQALWDEIGFGELRRVFRNRRRSFETEQLCFA